MLTQNSEEKKVNFFYLRDVLLKRESPSSNLLFEKTNALSKLKKYSHLQVFQFAIEPLLVKGSFCSQIFELVVQIEVI